MVKQFHWNVDKFTTYVSALLVTLTEKEGKDGLTFDKVYEVLTHSPCPLFNSEIVVYKQVHSTKLNMHKLLIKAREEYRSLVMTEQWLIKDDRSLSSAKRNKRSGIAALFTSQQDAEGKIKTIQIFIDHDRDRMPLYITCNAMRGISAPSLLHAR